MGLMGIPPPFLDGGRPAVMRAGVREAFRASPCSLGVEALGVEGFFAAPRSLGVPKLRTGKRRRGQNNMQSEKRKISESAAK